MCDKLIIYIGEVDVCDMCDKLVIYIAEVDVINSSCVIHSFILEKWTCVITHHYTLVMQFLCITQI